jgi:hypothetical protein
MTVSHSHSLFSGERKETRDRERECERDMERKRKIERRRDRKSARETWNKGKSPVWG